MPVEFNTPPTYRAVPDAVTGYALNQFDWSVVVPEGTTNFFVNPAFYDSDIASSVVQSGNNTLARVTALPDPVLTPPFGLYALRVTPTSTVLSSQIVLTALGVLPAGLVTFSTYFMGTPGEKFYWAPRDQDVGALPPTVFFTATGLLQRVYMTVLSSILTVRANPTGSLGFLGKLTKTLNPYYLSGVQIEPKPYMTTYCDGTQADCSWIGPSHRTGSIRPDNAPGGGGREYRLANLGFQVTAISGHDMPPYVAQTQQYGLVSGQEYDRTVSGPQTITLSNVIEGTNYRVTRKAKDKIIELLAPFSSQLKDRYLILRGRLVDNCLDSNFNQIGPTLEMPCRFVSDLSGNNDNYNQERFAISFVCDTPPGVRAVHEKGLSLGFTQNLDGTNSRVTYYKQSVPQYTIYNPPFSQWIAPIYTRLDPPNNNFQLTALARALGPNLITNKGPVWGAAYDGTNTTIGSMPDRTTTQGLTSGTFNNVVNAMVFANDGVLYMGGAWTGGTFSPSTPAYIAKNSSGSPLSVVAVGTTNIPNNIVRALVFVPYINSLFAFGDFTNSGTRWGAIAVSAGGGSPYSNTTWANPTTTGAGFNGTVRGALLLQNGKILIYGDFTTVNGVAYNRCVIYDPHNGAGTLSAVGKGFSNGSVFSAIQLPNGDIIFGGSFTLTGSGLTASYTAIYNGSQILPLGNNTTNGQVNSLAYHNNTLYAAGNFLVVADANNSITGLSSNGLTMLAGDYWVPTDLASNSSATGSFVGSAGGALYFSATAAAGAGTAAVISPVSYDGTADAYPTIVIRGTAGGGSIYSIVNQTTGASIYFNYNYLVDNEILTLKFAPTGLTINSNFYGDVTRLAMPNSDYTRFALNKRNTSEAATSDYVNPIQVLGVGLGSVEIYWRTTFQGFSAAATAAYNGL